MIINLRGEVWKTLSKPIWRDNAAFKVSNYGRIIVFNKDPEGQLLNPYDLGGYFVFPVALKKGRAAMTYVHRVVAEAFLEEEIKPFVVHKDYDKKNNKADNLMYVDRKGLSAHNMLNPRVIESKKKARQNPKYSKLSPGRVRLIKRKIFDPNRKTRMRLIAKQFGISEMQLYRIKSGENWGHITDY